jgi:hypothetical protein
MHILYAILHLIKCNINIPFSVHVSIGTCNNLIENAYLQVYIFVSVEAIKIKT